MYNLKIALDYKFAIMVADLGACKGGGGVL